MRRKPYAFLSSAYNDATVPSLQRINRGGPPLQRPPKIQDHRSPIAVMHKPVQSARIRRQALTGWHLWPHIQFFNSRSSLEMSVREVSSAAAAWIFKRKVSQRFSALHDIDVSTSRHHKCIFVGAARQACKDIFLLRMGSPGHRDQTFSLLVACQATQPSYHSIFASAATLSAYYAEARDLYRSQNRSWDEQSRRMQRHDDPKQQDL